VEREDYRVGVPTRKTLKLVLNSDEEKYGGKGEKRPLTYKPVKKINTGLSKYCAIFTHLFGSPGIMTYFPIS